MSLIISKQLPQTLSNDFAIVTVTNFYAGLRIFGFETYQDMDSKKNAWGGEYHNILSNKKFFIPLFFFARNAIPFKDKKFIYFLQNSRPALVEIKASLQHQFTMTLCEAGTT
jgi:hypothetical protein